MSFLGLLALAVVIVLALDVAIRRASRQIALKLIEEVYETEERREPQIPYAPPVRKPLDGTEARSRRIAMVAPASLHDKMTVRVRMISMAIALVERGHEVTIFLPEWDCRTSCFLKRPLAPLGFVHVRPGKLKSGTYDPILLARLVRRVMAFRPDIVYSFKSVGYPAAVSLLAYILSRVPWVGSKTTVRGVLVDTDNWEGLGGWADRTEEPYPLRVIRDRQERLTLRYCDAVTVTSTELQDRVVSLGKGKDRVICVPNGILPELWPTTPLGSPPSDLGHRLKQLGDPKVLLVYTKFTEFKAETLIRIFDGVLEIFPNTALLIVGASFDRQSRLERLKLQSLASQAGIESERIISVGWIPYGQLRQYWSVATVALYPVDDTLVNRAISPTKMLELMAARKAVVANNVGGIDEAIEDGRQGMLVPPGDTDAFTAAVVRLLADDDLRASLAQAANDTAHTQFDWRRIITKVEAAIQLCDQGAPESPNPDRQTTRATTDSDSGD